MLKPTPIHLNPEGRRRQKMRNWAIAAALLAFVAIVFLITIVKIKGGN